MCLGSSPKRLDRPHPELVHWWLLVHSSPDSEQANRFVTLICPEPINRFITLICPEPANRFVTLICPEPINRFITLICPELANSFVTLICTLEFFFVFLAVLPRCNAHIRVLFCCSIEAYLHHIVCLSRHPFGGKFEGMYRAAGG